MQTTNDQVIYSDYYVAFLDVLGFKNLVFNSSADAKSKIQKYFDITATEIRELKALSSKEPMQAIVISDAIILSFPAGTNKTEGIKNLRTLCKAIRKIQHSLALENIWLRGAISRGDAYFSQDSNQVVGPAYIQAYLLEEQHALFPRVIFDHKIVNKLKFKSASDLILEINRTKKSGEYEEWIKHQVLYRWKNYDLHQEGIQKDTPFFIDYLLPAFSETATLTRIIENIEQTLYSNNAIYLKFRWLVDYFMAVGKHAMTQPIPDAIEYDDIQAAIDRLSKL